MLHEELNTVTLSDGKNQNSRIACFTESAINHPRFSLIFSNNSEILLIEIFAANQLTIFFKQPDEVF